MVASNKNKKGISKKKIYSSVRKCSNEIEKENEMKELLEINFETHLAKLKNSNIDVSFWQNCAKCSAKKNFLTTKNKSCFIDSDGWKYRIDSSYLRCLNDRCTGRILLNGQTMVKKIDHKCNKPENGNEIVAIHLFEQHWKHLINVQKNNESIAQYAIDYFEKENFNPKYYLKFKHNKNGHTKYYSKDEAIENKKKAIIRTLESIRKSAKSAIGIGSSAPKRAAIEQNVPSKSNQPPTTSSNISYTSTIFLYGSQSQSQYGEVSTSSSFLTPPNSDQSNYWATPSPNYPSQQNGGQYQYGTFPPRTSASGICNSQPNATLSIPSIPRLKYPTQMDSQLTMRQLTSSTNQSIIHSSLRTPYYYMQPTIFPAYYQGHSNFASPNIHHQPQSSLAQYSAAISTANLSTSFTGNFHELEQPYFLQSSPFPSFQNEYNLDSPEAANPLNFRTHLNFGFPSIGFSGGNVDLGEQPQNESNNLTDLDQISKDELVPLVKNCPLSNYMMMAEKEEFNSFK